MPREVVVNQKRQLRRTRLPVNHKRQLQRTSLVKTSSQGASLIPPGATLLQVAASPRKSDALALAGVLRQKGFTVIILEPTGDNFYRVEVGPYADGQSARRAKLALNRDGFQVFVRRY